MNNFLRRYRKAVHLLALIPLLQLIWWFRQNNLTANPIQFITHWTGTSALVLLTLSLAVTPIKRMTGLSAIVPMGKWFGLWGFFYASLHLSTYVGLDYFFDWQLLWLEISGKRYVFVGFTAWLILLPLAVTSTKGWQRRLGRRWKLLHRSVYLVTPLAVVHFVWLVKSDYREPAIYGFVVALLLLSRFRRRLLKNKPAS